MNKDGWTQSWQEAKFGRQLDERVKAPSKSALYLYNSMPRKISSVVIPAQTEAIGLKRLFGSCELDE